MQTARSSLMDWQALADRVLSGGSISRAEALEVLRAPDDQTLSVLAAAYRIRKNHFGNKVHLHVLMNAQSGLCAEDCHYCSQSKVSTADIDVYPIRSKEWILAGARNAAKVGAATYCIVTSGRGPNDRAVDDMCDVVREIKQELPLHVCVCMGLLKDGQAERLKAAGVDRYNHNLNTSEAHTPSVVTTHTFQDRVETVERVKAAGISACSGAIFGMGETEADRVDVAFALKEIDSDSIPCNFLIAIPGTPFEKLPKLNANACLRILAMIRFVNPSKEIRIAGGREVQLGALQPLGLYAANSIFVNGYLTTDGQGAARDHAMIREMGFEVDSRPAKGG